MLAPQKILNCIDMFGQELIPAAKRICVRPRWRLFTWFFVLVAIAHLPSQAEPIPAKHKQGSNHAFVLLKGPDGQLIAVGDHVSVAEGNQVRSRLTFHFRDGSLDDESTVYTQGTVVHLVSDHHIQRGPSFPQPVDFTVHMASNELRWQETKNNKQEVKVEHKPLPADLANGLLGPVLENFPKGASELKVSYLAAGSSLRIVQLSIKPSGKLPFHVGGVSHDADQYTIHVELGGMAGAVAPLFGKQPSNTNVWLMSGEVPTFLRLQGALYVNGPIWTAELSSPVWSTDENSSNLELSKAKKKGSL